MVQNQKVILKMIAQASKGDARAALLNNETLRAMVLNSGANVTIYEGVIRSGKTCREMLSDVYIGLIRRKNKKGQPDGIGALGGMAERTSPEQFKAMNEAQRKALVGHKDDVIMVQGIPFLTHNMDKIRQNNVVREMREELADLGIEDEVIDPQKLRIVPMPKVKDDNYMINIWDGQGECYAVTPYCHLYKDVTGLIGRLADKAQAQENGEASGFVKVRLFDALGAYGFKGTKDCALEDGRHAKRDYRYPHEYLAAWALAAELLEHNPEKMIMLAKEVQAANTHPISFMRLTRATGQIPKDVAKVIGVTPLTLRDMEQAAVEQYLVQDYIASLKVPIKS